MKNKIAVVIISYKNDNQTIDFVKHIIKFCPDFCVVIVNNGADESSTRFICNSLSAYRVDNFFSKIESARIYIIHSNENIGFAKGNNLGATFVKLNICSEFILFSNTDIKILSESILTELVNKLIDHPDAGIIGPNIIGLDGKKQSPEPYLPFWTRYVSKPITSRFWSKAKRKRVLKEDYTMNAKEGYVDKVMGSFFMVRAKDYFDCGMMDPNTFLYYEELILSERMKAIGKYTYYYPDVTVVHEHGTTIKKYNSMLKMEKINFESAKYYYHTYKHTSKSEIYIGKLLYFTFWYLMILKDKFK